MPLWSFFFTFIIFLEFSKTKKKKFLLKSITIYFLRIFFCNVVYVANYVLIFVKVWEVILEERKITLLNILKWLENLFVFLRTKEYSRLNNERKKYIIIWITLFLIFFFLFFILDSKKFLLFFTYSRMNFTKNETFCTVHFIEIKFLK